MTAEEVVERFDAVPSVKSLKEHFGKYQKQVEKKHGVQLLKRGRGDNVEYFIVGNEIQSSIELIQDAHKEVIMDQSTFTNLIDWNFMVFIGIITCPFMSFRGTYKQFLEYVGIKNKDKENIQRLKDTFRELERNDYIYFVPDDSVKGEEEEYFGLFIKRKAEVEMKIGIDMIQECIKIQKQNNMRSWVPLLKTWLGLQLLVKDSGNSAEATLFTIDELSKTTGINRDMTIKCKKILESNNLYQLSRAYKNNHCMGQEVNLNILWRDQDEKK